jgi:hypothetical protein
VSSSPTSSSTSLIRLASSEKSVPPLIQLPPHALNLAPRPFYRLLGLFIGKSLDWIVGWIWCLLWCLGAGRPGSWLFRGF